MINKNDFDGNLVYGGADFNCKTGRHEIIESVVESDEYFKFNIDETEDIEFLKTCPFCKKDIKAEAIIKRARYSVFKCSMCGFIYQNPRVNKYGIEKIYSTHNANQRLFSNEYEIKLDILRYSYILQIIKNYCKPKSILDIGASNGLFLRVCADKGIKKLAAVEPNLNLINNSTFYGPDIKVLPSFYNSNELKFKSFDLVSMFTVLEHIIDFREALNNVYSYLSERGLIAVIVPNVYSLASRLIREKSPSFCLEHLSYFSTITLKRLLEEEGFKIIHSETIITEITHIKNYLEFKPPYSSKPDDEDIFRFITPEWIHDNNLGSRIFMIGQK